MSYIKKHWFDITVGLISLGLATYYFCTANINTAIIWLMSACIWWGMSCVEYNHERIEELELKSEKYDALVDKVKALEELVRLQDEYNKQKFKNLEERNESSRTLHS